MTIHYNRPDGDYAGWGLHLWGDAIDPSEGTEWATPKPPTAPMTLAPTGTCQIQDATKPVNFIIHNGDNKDPGPDQSLNPAETAAVWIKSADQTIYTQRCAADNVGDHPLPSPGRRLRRLRQRNFATSGVMHIWSAAEGTRLDDAPQAAIRV